MKRSYIPLLKYFAAVFPVTSLLCQYYTEPSGSEYQAYIQTTIETDYNAVLSKSANSVEYRLEALNHLTPIDLAFNAEVEKVIQQYLSKRKRDIEVYLQRSGYYFPVIEEFLDKYDLPLELKYITVVESGLNPLARSGSGAVGLWQFLFSTCSLFDLKVDSYIDQRMDIFNSTEAACRYLQYLYRIYNDWNLVLASYNSGPGVVRKAIERSGGKTDYWEIRHLLPEQSRNYVPVFIALNYLMNYYELYGIVPGKLNNTWDDVDTLHINYSVSFVQIAAVLNMPVSEIERLNPVYRKKVIPRLEEPCILVLPKSLISEYLRNEKEIRTIRVPKTDYNTLLVHAGCTNGRAMILHTVQGGEYLHKIALNYHCTIENLMAWNGLNSLDTFPGQILKIWVPRDTEQ